MEQVLVIKDSYQKMMNYEKIYCEHVSSSIKKLSTIPNASEEKQELLLIEILHELKEAEAQFNYLETELKGLEAEKIALPFLLRAKKYKIELKVLYNKFMSFEKFFHDAKFRAKLMKSKLEWDELQKKKNNGNILSSPNVKDSNKIDIEVANLDNEIETRPNMEIQRADNQLKTFLKRYFKSKWTITILIVLVIVICAMIILGFEMNWKFS